jgi:hypothetical protein
MSVRRRSEGYRRVRTDIVAACLALMALAGLPLAVSAANAANVPKVTRSAGPQFLTNLLAGRGAVVAEPDVSASAAPSASATSTPRSATPRTRTATAASEPTSRWLGADADIDGSVLLAVALAVACLVIVRRRSSRARVTGGSALATSDIPVMLGAPTAPGRPLAPEQSATPGHPGWLDGQVDADRPDGRRGKRGHDGRYDRHSWHIRPGSRPGEDDEHGTIAWLQTLRQLDASDRRAEKRPDRPEQHPAEVAGQGVRDRSSGEMPGENTAVTSDSADLAAAPMPASRPERGVPMARKPSTEDARVGDTAHQTSLSPVALRILGAQRSSAKLARMRDVSARRLELALGDDRIELVLAETPAVAHQGKAGRGRTWLAATPYLAWAPLPYDVPAGGAAFVCLGVGDEGCLFIDLAAAPGAVAIGGDRAAAGRLAESIAHQLCMSADSGRTCAVIAVGAALPPPLPAGVAWLSSLSELGSAPTDGGQDRAEVVFCELHSNEDAFALARYTNSAPGRVVPMILASLPDAPWTFTAHPRHPPGEAMQVLA